MTYVEQIRQSTEIFGQHMTKKQVFSKKFIGKKFLRQFLTGIEHLPY